MSPSHLDPASQKRDERSLPLRFRRRVGDIRSVSYQQRSGLRGDELSDKTVVDGFYFKFAYFFNEGDAFFAPVALAWWSSLRRSLRKKMS